jgi:hypothetical protein
MEYKIQEGEYTFKTIDENSNKETNITPIEDKEILDNFLKRFKTWEQLQRPWSGKL